eukprot:9178955-Heterocapsa_arctica.AAC.1
MAVKPARWRGRGVLLSLPCTPATRGPILLIDLWSGFSGASLALLSLGVPFYVLAAECDPMATKIAEAAIDQMAHVDAVEAIDARAIKSLIERRSIQGIN